MALNVLVDPLAEEQMDDGRLANEMTFEAIAKELREIKASVQDGFQRVDQQLNNAKIRDEELRSLAKFSLEANDALRESMETRFSAADKKQDEEIGLLKDVLRDLSRTRR